MIKTLALVIKRYNLRETDRILTVLTPALGKKRVVVNGVRRPLSKLAGHLDSLMISQVILTERYDLPRVTSAVMVEPFERIRADLTKFNQANQLIKLTEKIMVEDLAQQTLFQLTLDGLVRINRGIAWSSVWLWHLWGVAKHLGVAPTIRNCRRCGLFLSDGGVWSDKNQSAVCGRCQTGDSDLVLDRRTIKVFRILLTKDFPFFEKIVIPDETQASVERILLGEIVRTINAPWKDYASVGRDRS